jgi:CBS domain-containing protein
MTLGSIPVSGYMTKNVKTETENQNIHAACKIMRENDIGAVVIVRDKQEHQDSDSNNYKKPIGIITERYYKGNRIPRFVIIRRTSP